MQQLTSIILAGGRGTRIAHLRPDTPKPMVEVAGKPFLEWLTLYLVKAGLHDFVYSAGYKAEQIKSWADQFRLPDVTLATVVEENELGTGGAVFACIEHCGDWFVVLNGDTLAAFDVAKVTKLAGAADVDCVLVGLPVPDTSRYGSLDVAIDGRLTGFREKQPGAGLISAGFYLFRKAAIAAHARPGKLSLETDILPQMLDAGVNIRVIDAGDAPFIDIGTPETLAAADQFISSRLELFR